MNPEHPNLDLQISDPGRLLLDGIFAAGVGLVVKTGSSLRATLVDQLGIAADYVEEKLQTVFLNSRPVDDLDGVVLAPGDVLALSAAMPGLVGATLRRGGHLAAMRRDITQEKAETRPAVTAMITVKLFNLACRDLGPTLLARGILVRPKQLADLLAGLEDSPATSAKAVLNDLALDLADAVDSLGQMDPATLVKFRFRVIIS